MSEAPPVTLPIARSPVRPHPPVSVQDGWEVSTLRSHASLRLADRSPLAKVLVRAAPDGPVAAGLGVRFGRAERDQHATLVVGSAPGEWLLLGSPGSADRLAARVDTSADDRLVSVVDLTHGRALLRLVGADAPALLAKVCAIDLADRVTANGAVLRTAVAKLATEVVRDDVAGNRSYLLHCERSSGQYLYDVLYDAGREFGIEPDGFAYPEG